MAFGIWDCGFVILEGFFSDQSEISNPKSKDPERLQASYHQHPGRQDDPFYRSAPLTSVGFLPLI